ncbi:MAG: NB-ARC domain-containing protein [Caldilineaceae bacterium]
MSAARLKNLHDAVQQAMKQWRSREIGASALTTLCVLRQIQRERHLGAPQAVWALLNEALARLAKQDADAAQLLRMRFVDDTPVHQVAVQLHRAESTIYGQQRQALVGLCSVLAQMEEAALKQQTSRQLPRLEPATYERLVGGEAHLDRLMALLVTPEPPRIVALEGIGGIGKTSLADALLRRVIEQGLFEEIGWVSARQQYLNLGGVVRIVPEAALTAEELVDRLFAQLLTAGQPSSQGAYDQRLALLRAHLKEIPHLIVVDNLETLLDVESLLPTLQDLANPTKFVLTARERVYGVSRVYHYTLPELAPPHALELLRLEAQMSNLPSLLACSDEELMPIVETVGGNPLALRLVVGQAQIYDLAQVLADLQQARGQSAANLYTYIYRQSWQRLDRPTQEALLLMPLARPQGESLDYLAQIGGMDVETLKDALAALVRYNLVDVRGDIHSQHYSIHGLTRTFLQEQVAKWM